MIRSLSPYYITIPWVAPLSGETATDVLINIYVWNGLKDEVPTDPTYQVTKENALSSTDSFKLNIANWINDFIELSQQNTNATGVIFGNNQQWVKWETYYTTDESVDYDFPSNENVKLFARGYNYGMDGDNAIASKGFLTPLNEYKVSLDSVFCIPYLSDYDVDPANTPIVELNINSLTKDAAPDPTLYNLDYTTANETQPIYLETSATGANNYDGVLPNVKIEVTENSIANVSLFLGASGDYDVRLSSFDPNYNQIVTSNVVTITFTL